MPTPWNHSFQLKRVLERISAAQFASIKQISCFDGSGFSTSHMIVSAPASSIQSRPPLFFLCAVTLFPTRAFCWERADHTANAGTMKWWVRAAIVGAIQTQLRPLDAHVYYLTYTLELF